MLPPSQTAKLETLTLPYLKIGICEVANSSPHAFMSSFSIVNRHNLDVYSSEAEAAKGSECCGHYGEVVSAGIADSYTGGFVSKCVADSLARSLGMHTVLPAQIRQLRRQFPDDPLLDIMQMGLTRHGDRWHPQPRTRAQQAERYEIKSVLSEWYARQYATSADISFFKACKDEAKGDFDRFLALADQGCRAAWFSACVVPIDSYNVDSSTTEVLPPSSSSSSSATIEATPAAGDHDSFSKQRSAEVARLREVRQSQRYHLEVLASGVGNCRIFGIARNRLTHGTRSALDPTRERLVPLSSDHSPLRTLEMNRIMKAGGTVDFSVSDYIDGNPFYNVSRSFGHWSMKNNKKLSYDQQKLICEPTSLSWTMLKGDILVLVNKAMFETRNNADTSVDDVAKVIGQEIDRGSSPEDTALALCNCAARVGAEHSLQAIVAVAT